MKCAFIGLGVMGFHMAGHLQTAGHQVTVFNRTAEKAQAWAKTFGGTPAATPGEAAQGADFVMACVGRDADVEAVTIGEGGAFHTMAPGAVFIDHTTASADLARALWQRGRDIGIDVLDAPVSGGEAGAQNGQLTIMVGGSEAVFEKAAPVLKCYAKQVGLMGPAGAGQATKMVNQICIAGLVQGLSEAIHFGQAAGLDIAKVVDVISQGAAGSWQMANRAETMAAGKFDFGFAVDWMRKDLGIVFAEAERLGLDLPITKMVDQFYAEVQANGGGRYDTSSLITRFSSKR
ncbi:MAG: NAD(P)-dependent oxidoreductase [Pseudomonadota bacterium]